jgi:hypothetical protein
MIIRAEIPFAYFRHSGERRNPGFPMEIGIQYE